MESNNTTCEDILEAVSIVKGVFGGLGAIACTVALVSVIVSRFYIDIVQRLILYKLITMIVFSISLFLFLKYDDHSNTYKSFATAIPNIVYFVNLVLTFWLTITLYFCIVHLKEIKNIKKLEPIAIITSSLPLAITVYIPFASFDTCTQSWYINIKGGNHDYVIIFGYIIAGILYLIISILVIVIFIATIKRSRLHLQ